MSGRERIVLLRAAPSPEVKAARARARSTPLHVNCEGCGTVVHRCTVYDAEIRPSVTMLDARQRLVKHCAETGCPGVKPVTRNWHLACGSCVKGLELMTIGLPRFRETCEVCGAELGDRWHAVTSQQFVELQVARIHPGPVLDALVDAVVFGDGTVNAHEAPTVPELPPDPSELPDPPARADRLALPPPAGPSILEPG